VPEINLEQVSKNWGSTRAVDEITFTAEAGSFTVLLGPSGCGKSTTLRLIAGLEDVSAGRISIGQRDITRQPPAQRDLSMVFQNYALFPHLSVAENILFGLRVRKVARAERNRRLQRTVELLNLNGLLERRPSQLSGGQQQRVALGRAIIAEKPVCLMDEPLSNLDAKLRHEMRIEIRALQQQLGISMIYVTHDQAEAMSMADRVILLRDGHIEQNAPPETVYQKPASTFVARFIGTPPMNILRLADGPHGASIAGLQQPLTLPGYHSGMWLGIRPENIHIVQSDGLPARVRSVEYLGADSIVDCHLGDQIIAVRTPGKTGLAPGEQVALSWQHNHIHLFEAGSGRRFDG
jgi:sn-glycerol 3-phosphate transport system ATP-binding protein